MVEECGGGCVGGIVMGDGGRGRGGGSRRRRRLYVVQVEVVEGRVVVVVAGDVVSMGCRIMVVQLVKVVKAKVVTCRVGQSEARVAGVAAARRVCRVRRREACEQGAIFCITISIVFFGQ